MLPIPHMLNSISAIIITIFEYWFGLSLLILELSGQAITVCKSKLFHLFRYKYKNWILVEEDDISSFNTYFFIQIHKLEVVSNRDWMND